MATTKNISRFDRAVFSKLDTSLERISEELEEMDEAIIDVTALKVNVEAVLNDMYTDINEADEKGSKKALMVLGMDKNTCPAPLARSVAIYGLQEVLKELYKSLEVLEDSEDKKLDKWARKMTGIDNVRVDIDKLIVRKSWDETIYRGLKLSKLVLDEDKKKLRRFIDNIGSTNDGDKAFIRDLGAARLADEKIDRLLQDLWNVKNTETLDEVLEAVMEQEVMKPFINPVEFYAEILRKKLALPVEEQQELLVEIMEE